jgi:septal ring factor EnvC (AmiA/AmiB activator)
MTVEGWKSLFDWGTVILLFLTFAFGAGALITGGILGKQEEEKSRQFEKDLTEAKTKLVEQQERTAAADSRVAGLETDAANAKGEMAKQQARAANAERALLELQQSLADRDISSQQRDRMLKVLKGKAPGHIVAQS